MAKGIFVIGTDTDVGKTVVTGGLVYLLRSKGYNTCYFKPVLSGAINEDGCLIPGDTRFVKAVSGLEEDYQNITPYIFKTPVSPLLASKMEDKPIDVGVIREKFQYLKSKYDYIVAEGSGGLIVPLTDDGYMLYDLVRELDMHSIVVTRAGLGTINHTVLTVRYAQSVGIRVKGIIMNGYTGCSLCEDDNIEVIEKLTEIPVIGVIHRMDGIDVEKLEMGDLKEEFEKRINVKKLIELMNQL
ncbi:MAG: dethiobiotin synthetase [Thermosediminibacterales bacterium]|nr:dethiobiotin synthetase [Thermosediminibacterales bacterium]MDK2835757.1 dethiobiotin synthetase [Thermosediminibacterales bacterium]